MTVILGLGYGNPNQASAQNLNFTYYTSWGSAGEEDGQFGGQNDVDYFNGKVYVPDYENHRIQIFDPEGNFLAKFGEGGEGDGQFHYRAFWI